MINPFRCTACCGVEKKSHRDRVSLAGARWVNLPVGGALTCSKRSESKKERGP